MKAKIPIYIGYDSREAVAYHVCVQSIIENCSEPDRLSFHPVTGERRDGSNDFIYARFLVPWRQFFHGHAIFIDGDMIVRGDILELWEMRLYNLGAQVVRRTDYETKHPVKYLGNRNENYPRKNWSSVILWNCGYGANRVLFPEYVQNESGASLHRFQWLNDSAVGELPQEWNRLVLEEPVHAGDKLLHYTIGTPCFAEYADCEASEDWHKTYARAIAPL
jgi:hypothetical protein